MNKKNEIKKILNLIVLTKGLNISESKIDSIAEKLNNISTATRNNVKSEIGFGDKISDGNYGDIIIKESIDFSDTDRWIDVIVDIINKK